MLTRELIEGNEAPDAKELAIVTEALTVFATSVLSEIGFGVSTAGATRVVPDDATVTVNGLPVETFPAASLAQA